MRCFYVSGKIADLDLGSEINAEKFIYGRY